MTDIKKSKKSDIGVRSPVDFFDIVPTKVEKSELRKASKTPADWLKLLCTTWSNENLALVEATNDKLLEQKPFLKGKLSAQLLCRLSIPDPPRKNEPLPQHAIEFWKSLGIVDDFDRCYIVSQVERFCTVYNLRGLYFDDEFPFGHPFFPSRYDNTPTATATRSPTASAAPYAAANGIDAAAAAATAYAAAAAASVKLKAKSIELAKTQAKHSGTADILGDHLSVKSLKFEQRRLSMEKKEARMKEREAANLRKAADKAARDATREERRQKKILLRLEREKFVQNQKEAALKRAADLVRSNRVPIEITRGAAAAQAAADAVVAATVGPLPPSEPTRKKARSAIVVSTAHDLHQIVTHSRNLWAKYNAIAREHNQKVNWITVAKELGIHVKVREKYARMYARAEQRGFCFRTCGHYKIKDHPHIFLEPSSSEKKMAKDTVDTSVYGEGHAAYEAEKKCMNETEDTNMNDEDQASNEAEVVDKKTDPEKSVSDHESTSDSTPPSTREEATAVEEAMKTSNEDEDSVEGSVVDAVGASEDTEMADNIETSVDSVMDSQAVSIQLDTKLEKNIPPNGNLAELSSFTKVYPVANEFVRDSIKT